MKWKEITVHTTTFGSELVSDVFFNMGACGVVVADKKDVLDTLKDNKMWDYVDEDLLNIKSEVVLVKAFVTSDLYEDTLVKLRLGLDELAENAVAEFPIGSLEIISREIDDEDWMNVWKKHYKPIHIREVVICPEWIDYKRKKNETVVKIDPGMAFGTGEHETTAMCIDLMQDCEISDKNIFDVGCGSGILGLTALKLGAHDALMVDFDPQAVKASKHNLDLNNVLSLANVVEGDLLCHAKGQCDILFANITADILLRLLSGLSGFVREGGAIIISGLINSRVDEVVSAYESSGLKLIRRVNNGEWNAASFKKEGI